VDREGAVVGVVAASDRAETARWELPSVLGRSCCWLRCGQQHLLLVAACVGEGVAVGVGVELTELVAATLAVAEGELLTEQVEVQKVLEAALKAPVAALKRMLVAVVQM